MLIPRARAYGSSWSEMIKLLRGAGIAVTAVQNPLISLADDTTSASKSGFLCIRAVQHSRSSSLPTVP